MFVYGTLLTNFHNWRLYVQPMLSTGQAQLHSEAVTEARFPMIVTAERNVPAIYNCDAGNHIRGEVYDMSESCVQALDIIEGTKDGFYTRLPLMAKSLSTGEVLECDSYFKGSGKKLVLEDSDKEMEEIRQLATWMEHGKPFLSEYTKDLHESYYVLDFKPEVLSRAAKKSIEEVQAVYTSIEPQLQGKTEREKTEVLATIWEKLL